jgi:hypothetical protein
VVRGILKLNPLIIDKIKSQPVDDKIKKFLEDILYIELEKLQKAEEKYSSEYEQCVEKYMN